MNKSKKLSQIIMIIDIEKIKKRLEKSFDAR